MICEHPTSRYSEQMETGVLHFAARESAWKRYGVQSGDKSTKSITSRRSMLAATVGVVSTTPRGRYFPPQILQPPTDRTGSDMFYQEDKASRLDIKDVMPYYGLNSGRL